MSGGHFVSQNYSDSSKYVKPPQIGIGVFPSTLIPWNQLTKNDRELRYINESLAFNVGLKLSRRFQFIGEYNCGLNLFQSAQLDIVEYEMWIVGKDISSTRAIDIKYSNDFRDFENEVSFLKWYLSGKLAYSFLLRQNNRAYLFLGKGMGAHSRVNYSIDMYGATSCYFGCSFYADSLEVNRFWSNNEQFKALEVGMGYEYLFKNGLSLRGEVQYFRPKFVPSDLYVVEENHLSTGNSTHRYGSDPGEEILRNRVYIRFGVFYRFGNRNEN